MTTQERNDWLKARKKGIGGSDIAAIMGLDPFRTPLDVWLDKTQEITSDFSPAQEEAMDRGLWLEVPLLDWLATQGVTDDFKHNTSLFIDNDFDYFICTPDAIGNNVIVEAKTTANFQAEPLEKWFLQGQWNLGVTGRNILILVWLDASLIRRYQIYERNDNIINLMRQKARDFWINNIIGNLPPPLINANDVAKLYNEHTEGKTTTAEADDYDIYLKLIDINNKINELDKEKTALTDLLKLKMQDAEKLIYNNKAIVTWKTSINSTINSKALKAEHPEIYEKYLTKTISRRFLIK